jgi:transcriptional regulator with XRE-family HTH domain
VRPQEQFAAALRRHRLAAGLSQIELGHRSDLHFSEISRLERGLRDPRLTTMSALARGLDMPLSQLLEDVR